MSDPANTVDESPPAGPRRRSRVAPFVALGIAAVFALLFFVFAQSDGNQADSADTPLMFQPAPDAEGPLDAGGTFDLGGERGDWVVLNFFDSTCVPCVEEHPALVGFDESQEARGADGAELVTIVWGDHPDGAREFFAENGGDWPVVFDDGSIATAFGVTKVPETWIIDPNGFVVRRFISTVTTEFLDETIVGLQGVEA